MSPAPAPPPDVVRTLVANHRAFLGFLERRLPDRATAEDVLQDAFVRGLERAGEVRDEESATAWFYRVLRNSLVDRARRQGARSRAHEAAAHEAPTEVEADPELANVACGCVAALAQTLQDGYRLAVQRVDVDGASIADFAAEAGITPENARVRLHRARKALRARVADSCGTCAEHGCWDCTCAPTGKGGCGDTKRGCG